MVTMESFKQRGSTVLCFSVPVHKVPIRCSFWLHNFNYILYCHAAETVGVSVGGSFGGVAFVVIIGCVVLICCCQGLGSRRSYRAHSPPRSYTVVAVLKN